MREETSWKNKRDSCPSPSLSLSLYIKATISGWYRGDSLAIERARREARYSLEAFASRSQEHRENRRAKFVQTSDESVAITIRWKPCEKKAANGTRENRWLGCVYPRLCSRSRGQSRFRRHVRTNYSPFHPRDPPYPSVLLDRSLESGKTRCLLLLDRLCGTL